MHGPTGQAHPQDGHRAQRVYWALPAGSAVVMDLHGGYRENINYVGSSPPLWGSVVTATSAEKRDHAPRRSHSWTERRPLCQDNGGRSVAGDKCVQASCLVAVAPGGALSCAGGHVILDTRMGTRFGQSCYLVHCGDCLGPSPMVGTTRRLADLTVYARPDVRRFSV